MKKLKLCLAVLACKMGILASKMLGKAGSSMPGNIAMKICPDILKQLSSQVRKEIIAVCGTNGKTTTNNLLHAFLKGNGNKVISNLYGANMLPGVCCVFAASANIFGKIDADYACLEIDEASARLIFDKLTPHKMIITNLFRDQLDRYGEISKTADMLKKALDLSTLTELIINGDDPFVSSIGFESGRVCHYLGVEEKTDLNADFDENALCPLCGEKLSYEYRHYAQLGNYHCPSCSFKRPEISFKISEVSCGSNLIFDIDILNSKYHFDINYKGFYNIYNVAMAFSAAHLLMGEVKNYSKIISDYKPQIGRMQEFNIGKRLILNMSKNPAGFNQGISAVCSDVNSKTLVLSVNDAPSDGIDITWLWDVDFEKLLSSDISGIYLCGTRAADLAVRLKYAGFDLSAFKVCTTYKEALENAKTDSGINCYCLANYTATFKLHEILVEMKKEI